MKAILVIDMPNECDGCPCLNQKLWECQADKKRRSSDERPSWCPLRPMPQKNEIKNEEEFMNVCGWMYEVQTGMDVGWNACIDEIMGETE